MFVLTVLSLLATLAAIVLPRFHARRVLRREVGAGYNVAQLLALHRANFGTAVMAFNDLTSRTDAQALMPEEVSRDIIRSLTSSSLALNMLPAGNRKTMSRKQTRMPILTALANAYFVNGDTGLKQTTKEAWGNKFLNAEEIAVIVPVPQNVLDDADYDLWGEMKPDLIEAAGALIDAAILFGLNKPTTWGPAIVPGAAAAGNTFTRGSVAGKDVASDINSAMRLVAADGFPITGFVADSLFEFDLQGLRDTQNRPIFDQNLQDRATGKGLYGRDFMYLNNGAWDPTQADLIAGDWSQAMIGVRQDITYTMHTDGVISDANGAVVLNLMQQDSAALRMVMRVGWEIANPISRRTAALAAANRFPFSVVRPTGFTGP